MSRALPRELLLLLGLANWAVAQQFTLEYAAAGLPGLVANQSKGLLITDSADDGFVGFGDPQSNAVGSFAFTVGAAVDDDVVLAVMTAQDVAAGSQGFQPGVLPFNPAEAVWQGRLIANRKFALLTFYQGTRGPTDTVGCYRADTITDPQYGANQAYFVPPAGSTATIISVAAGLQIAGGPPGTVALSAFTARDRAVGGFPIPELLGLNFLANGTPQLLLASAPGQLLVVDWSENLTTWQELARQTATSGQLLFPDPAAQTLARRFYRWRRES